MIEFTQTTSKKILIVDSDARFYGTAVPLADSIGSRAGHRS